MPNAKHAKPYYTIHDLPEGARPRERLARLGPQALSDAELIAIILRSGAQGVNVIDMATDLMRYYRTLPALAQVSFTDLQRHRGVGAAKAAQIMAAIELGRRVMRAAPESRPRVDSPESVARLLLSELAYTDQEHVKVVLIDSRNQVIATPTIYKGTLNTTTIRIGEIFKEAIRRNAAAIIVAHNHPSGDPTPSPQDVILTRRIVEAGRLLNIDVLDHLILGHDRWVSMKERRLGFT
ncbi:MAG TPA: JAB domain-containing protein [Caldilineae bacterium]|nr:JAB domain-containing protein [Caldilineae bacterium]HIQ11256.1 JAB domain-containing protein [Caldilineales bacterium]